VQGEQDNRFRFVRYSRIGVAIRDFGRVSMAADFFLIDQRDWADERAIQTAPSALVEEAQRSGARRKRLAQGEAGFHTPYSELPPGFTIPVHHHDHDEVIILVDGGCTVLGDGPEMRARDSVVIKGGTDYGFMAGPDGMRFFTIRTQAASTSMVG
jgi:quercetin dioxygenase-like cupin family protein